eukprot:SAG11_NODE_1454_length_4879_cov_4.858577_1_plen_62_part_00
MVSSDTRLNIVLAIILNVVLIKIMINRAIAHAYELIGDPNTPGASEEEAAEEESMNIYPAQ